jgi:polysaccharide export outer membrane protein
MKADEISKKRCRPELPAQRREGWKCLVGLWALAIFLALIVSGCETNSNSSAPAFTHLNELFPSHPDVMSQADIISITFRYSTNFNTVQKIGPDGMVNLESVGEVKAEGKTLEQLQRELSGLYKAEVKDDPITIRIVSAAAAIYVTGAVTRPGKFAMDRRMTVVDAIAEAGGADPYRAKLSKVSVLRVDGEAQKIYWLNLSRVLDGKDSTPFYLKPFDVVRVPTKTFNF